MDKHIINSRQVVSLGGGDGPRGVSVKLLDDKTVVGEVVTADEGR